MSRTDFATKLARTHGARVIILCPLKGDAGACLHAEHARASAVAHHVRAERLRAARIGTRLARQMTRQGIRADWIATEGPVHEVLASRSAIADLVIVSWSEAAWVSPQASSVVVAAGRPVLVVPAGNSFASCAQRVLVAWNASREAARAMQDALPFLQRAEQVILLSAGDDAGVASSVSDAVAYLEAHDVTARPDHRAMHGHDAGQAILRAARCHRADMIVMGAFGHSRLHEWTFGGATRTVLQSVTVPTLLSR
ncbi:MAG: universal stress protein [Alphaproteobacteria bacterium]|nr:universal stress protein [Alphaproteobacteria bacterium]